MEHADGARRHGGHEAVDRVDPASARFSRRDVAADERRSP